MAKRVYQNSKDVIVDAAMKLLVKKGLKGFTTDAVIRASGLSKAGFFYNFGTKDELVQAMVRKLIKEWDDAIERLTAADPNPTGRTLRAYVQYTIEQLDRDENFDASLYQLLNEVSVSQPAFYSKVTAEYMDSLPFRVREGLAEEQATMIYFALEGFWMQSCGPNYGISKPQKKRLLNLMLEMTNQPKRARRGMK